MVSIKFLGVAILVGKDLEFLFTFEFRINYEEFFSISIFYVCFVLVVDFLVFEFLFCILGVGKRKKLKYVNLVSLFEIVEMFGG